MEEELHWADYREKDMYRAEYMDSAKCRKNVDDPHLSPLRSVLEPSSVPMYDSLEEMSHSEGHHVDYYPDKAPSYLRSYPENDQLKEFYSEEVRRRRNRSAEYEPSQRVYQDDEHQWSPERDPGRHDRIIRLGRQGSSEPEAKRVPIPVKSDLSQDHLFNIIQSYRHERRETQQVDAMSSSGPSRSVPSSSHRQVTRTISDIPEPFRRFLKGDNDDERQSKRKRKSRFSNATAEEVEMTKEM